MPPRPAPRILLLPFPPLQPAMPKPLPLRLAVPLALVFNFLWASSSRRVPASSRRVTDLSILRDASTRLLPRPGISLRHPFSRDRRSMRWRRWEP
jgi:hypothetical protein